MLCCPRPHPPGRQPFPMHLELSAGPSRCWADVLSPSPSVLTFSACESTSAQVAFRRFLCFPHCPPDHQGRGNMVRAGGNTGRPVSSSVLLPAVTAGPGFSLCCLWFPSCQMKAGVGWHLPQLLDWHQPRIGLPPPSLASAGRGFLTLDWGFLCLLSASLPPFLSICPGRVSCSWESYRGRHRRQEPAPLLCRAQ